MYVSLFVSSLHHQSGEVISVFLNAMLCSPLPIDGLACLAEFLQLSDASTNGSIHTHKHGPYSPATLTRSADSDASVNSASAKANEVFRLLSLCTAEFQRAEHQSEVAERLSKTVTSSDIRARNNLSGKAVVATLVTPFSPPSSSNQFRAAMHTALMKVMEERDEAHARMVSAEVLHVHEMEQHRKKISHLSSQLSTMKKRDAFNGTPAKFRDDKIKRDAAALRVQERSLQQDTDAELLSLCQQLAGEISARTSACLEVIRLKENRNIELENELVEKQALRDEVSQLRDQLSLQHRNAALARQESGTWRESYEEIVQIRDTATSPAE